MLIKSDRRTIIERTRSGPNRAKRKIVFKRKLGRNNRIATKRIDGRHRAPSVTNLSGEELDQVFHFYSNGTFDLLNVPGKSKREQTLNTYVLTGLGWYLASQGKRDFNDSMAREFCEQIGCYDQANHAAHLKSRGNEFTGDKIRGYTITNPGMKKGVALIKEAAGEGI